MAGVLDSYHGNYDVPSEAIQNAVDAVEDAKLLGLDGSYLIAVVVNLSENWMSFLDTGIGMTVEEIARAFAPHVSFKANRKPESIAANAKCTAASKASGSHSLPTVRTILRSIRSATGT